MNEQQIQQEHDSAKTLGIVALICGFVCWPAGIICGHISLSKYKKLGNITEGKGLAKAGTIIGYAVGSLSIIFFILYIVFVALLFATNSYSN